jgi:hypothetical protein
MPPRMKITVATTRAMMAMFFTEMKLPILNVLLDSNVTDISEVQLEKQDLHSTSTDDGI